jgi:uncharacterized flavoprotein (TIGR03862 family)
MKKRVAIIGSGPAALMLASALDPQKFEVTIYEKNFAPARKFLVAGDGGFNLTHSEDIDAFIKRYTPQEFLEPCLRAFSNADLRNWLKQLGIETFVGSSKRVFPVKGIKPIDVLNAILSDLGRKNVSVKTSCEWTGWSEHGELMFTTKTGPLLIDTDITVLALGGASWKKTGSDGSWANLLSQKGIEIIPFRAANCAYEIKWDAGFLSQYEGGSLKNISLSCGGHEKKGELVITKFGIEGGAIYALSPQIREELEQKKTATIYLDLKPEITEEEIKKRLTKKRNASLTQSLKDDINLDAVKLALLKSLSSKEEFTDVEKLAQKIKRLPATVLSAAPIDEAISTVGGIALNEVDEFFQLKKLPGIFAIGEMLDWDAPTGGYLLQACFSMGAWVGERLNSGTRSQH